MSEIKITVQKITRETSAKVTGSMFGTRSAHYGHRASKVTSYQATATYGKLTTQSGICDSRKKAIENATRNMNSFINSARSQGLEIE